MSSEAARVHHPSRRLAATAWPLAARAQQAAVPVVGLLHATSSYYFAQFADAVRQGMRESGVIEGRDATIEYRWAEGQNDRLPTLAADLVSKRVAVSLTGRQWSSH